jgi:hypothetical protein
VSNRYATLKRIWKRDKHPKGNGTRYIVDAKAFKVQQK